MKWAAVSQMTWQYFRNIFTSTFISSSSTYKYNAVPGTIQVLGSVCVCVCVFFPSILDIKFVRRTSRGHTGGRSHRIFNPPSFCGACLDFCREKDSAIPFPRVCVVFSSHPFWTSSSLDVPSGVTQEEGHTGFLIHLPSAVRALIFVARRIQPFLSLVDREVEFCVLTN